MRDSNQFEYRTHGNIALHKYKAIYFFIPKVACSSLKIVCSQLLDMEPPDPENPLYLPHKRHFPFIRRREILAGSSDYFKFAFTRNPWGPIGFPPIDLPHLLKSRRSHYKSFFTDDTIEMVAKRYAKDIKLFGYEL